MLDATRACEVLVGLPAVNVLAVVEPLAGPVAVTVESRVTVPACGDCGARAWVKDRPVVELVDLTCFGRAVTLRWRKHRWCCPQAACTVGSWTHEDPRIAAPRLSVTDRAGRWATEQVGRRGRAVSDVAAELGATWHAINDAVLAYGQALLDADHARVGAVEALGVDEVLFAREGRWRTQVWSTSIVDVGSGQLLDVLEGRSSAGLCDWLAERPEAWRDNVAWATLDLSGPWRAAFDTMLPDAVQVADPFHLVKLANQRLDEVRRRVQNETMGHRGHKDDPLYRCRRLLTKAHERLDDKGEDTSCWACSKPATPTARSERHGMPRRPFAASTASMTPTLPTTSSSVSATTSKTSPARQRSTSSAAPSCAGGTRSPPGTTPE
jgi:transposase